MKKVLFITLISTLIFSGRIVAQLSATVSSTPTQCSSNTGSASVTPSGGNNYTYKWSTGSTSSSINNVAAGTYTVTVYASGGPAGFTIDTLYKETFDEVNPAWTLNISTGQNDTYNNFWDISDTCGGVAPGSCGTGQTPNGNKTLYVTNQHPTAFGASNGAAYDAGDANSDCAYVYYGLYCTTTNLAAQSGNISTMGAHNLILTHNFIGNGQGLTDNGTLLYSVGGATFTTLDPSLKSFQGCGPEDGLWANRRYYLPSSCNNVTNFIIRYNWTNDDDGAGSDPSVALNDVMILDSISTGGAGSDSIVKTISLVSDTVAPPTVTATPPKICASDSSYICVNGTFAHYAWNTTSSGNTTDTNQCIYASGAQDYYVSVTNSAGCTATSSHVTLQVYPSPSVSITVEGDTLVSFGQVSYQWFKDGSAISGATSNVYIASSPGFYQVQVTDTNNCKTLSSSVETGVQNLNINGGFEIFPNPTSSNSLQLTVSTECMGCSIEIHDMEGRLVYTGKVTGQKQEIDISSLAKGAYMINVSGAAKEFIRQ